MYKKKNHVKIAEKKFDNDIIWGRGGGGRRMIIHIVKEVGNPKLQK